MERGCCNFSVEIRLACVIRVLSFHENQFYPTYQHQNETRADQRPFESSEDRADLRDEKIFLRIAQEQDRKADIFEIVEEHASPGKENNPIEIESARSVYLRRRALIICEIASLGCLPSRKISIYGKRSPKSERGQQGEQHPIDKRIDHIKGQACDSRCLPHGRCVRADDLVGLLGRIKELQVENGQVMCVAAGACGHDDKAEEHLQGKEKQDAFPGSPFFEEVEQFDFHCFIHLVLVVEGVGVEELHHHCHCYHLLDNHCLYRHICQGIGR